MQEWFKVNIAVFCLFVWVACSWLAFDVMASVNSMFFTSKCSLLLNIDLPRFCTLLLKFWGYSFKEHPLTSYDVQIQSFCFSWKLFLEAFLGSFSWKLFLEAFLGSFSWKHLESCKLVCS